MKNYLLKSALSCAVVLFCYGISNAQNVTAPPGGGNQRSAVTQYIGSLVTVTIDYNSPDVHAPNGDDRKGNIWGQLVPYGVNNLGFGLSTAENPSPWRAGANQNTTIEISHDVEVQGKALTAGKYGLHIIPQESGPWSVIFSKNSTAWGSFFYKESDDALRVETTKESSDYHEWLSYEFTDRQPDKATVALMWEEIKVPFTITVPKMTEYYVNNMRNELENTRGFSWQGWASAATYCANNDTNLEEALTWAENGVSAPFFGQKNWTTLSAKATVLNKLSRTDEALAVMDEAIGDPSATSFAIHGYARTLVAQGKKDKALEAFKVNHKKFNGAWPTSYGLSRGYSAVGDFKNALKYIKLAQKNVPQGDTLNPPVIEANIKKLENKEDIN